jgi:plastocyanin
VPTTLEARAGEVTVALRNRDLFWHTFTVDALGVDVRSPVGRLRTATFEARAGRYSYYCAIPGHAALGMRGTLTVR